MALNSLVHSLLSRLPAGRPARLAMTGTALLVCFSVAVGVAFSRPAVTTMRTFEIRVIDDDGHPVAGAEVKSGKQQFGVTDSFGIWRRSIRVGDEPSIRFDFRKRSAKAGQRELVATKKFALSATGENNSADRQKRQVVKGSVKMEPARL
ncbi:MAG: hypothetical protein RIQ81_1618 [Pseudomonadota bacterium]|jgi:hypothetical protein